MKGWNAARSLLSEHLDVSGIDRCSLELLLGICFNSAQIHRVHSSEGQSGVETAAAATRQIYIYSIGGGIENSGKRYSECLTDSLDYQRLKCCNPMLRDVLKYPSCIGVPLASIIRKALILNHGTKPRIHSGYKPHVVMCRSDSCVAMSSASKSLGQ